MIEAYAIQMHNSYCSEGRIDVKYFFTLWGVLSGPALPLFIGTYFLWNAVGIGAEQDRDVDFFL